MKLRIVLILLAAFSVLGIGAGAAPGQSGSRGITTTTKNVTSTPAPQATPTPQAEVPRPTPPPGGNHEYAPIQEKTVNYKNWTLNDLANNKPTTLRSLMQGKKLVMVLYFAPWCPNWRNEAPVAAKLYEKYKSQGFEIVGVGEYGTRTDVQAYFATSGGAPYPVVMESESRDEREKTAHFGYRQLTGDTRKWGSPWNIFLDPAKCNTTGDVLTEKAFIVNGELIEDEADKFIHDRLAANAVITPCKQ